ncbi:hypothetical protein CFHF_19925 [Caulobacter flavus]|uniref:Uncharacterized protein n=1 Tax=Caulobacter flavus TaxID=1679497 RepID=A0A2N5CP47_9CAUL|nr:hypothetical protein [Caulobacter flavus]AYV48562.1 hypothetical protein C1707_21140 [Caulobacter flavus]PLR08721.1 hypothetical protein CFHF_19925 [Caulobacter flavus]
MTLAPRITFALAPPLQARWILTIAVAVLVLTAAMAFVVLVVAQPSPLSAAPRAAATPSGPLAKAGDPLCAAALAKARDTRGLSAQEAIDASTAMLRACAAD